MWFTSGRNLDQIVLHGRKVQEFCEGLDQDAFVASPSTHDAVGMNLTAIGQHLMSIRADDPDTFAQITAGHAGIGLRHRLAHQYVAIKWNLVWAYTATKLPRLIEEAAVLRDRFIEEYGIELG